MRDIFFQQLGIDFQLSLKGNLQELHDNIVSKILLLRPDANRSILMVNADKIILDSTLSVKNKEYVKTKFFKNFAHKTG